MGLLFFLLGISLLFSQDNQNTTTDRIKLSPTPGVMETEEPQWKIKESEFNFKGNPLSPPDTENRLFDLDLPIHLSAFAGIRGFSSGGKYQVGATTIGTKITITDNDMLLMAITAEWLSDQGGESSDPQKKVEWSRAKAEGSFLPMSGVAFKEIAEIKAGLHTRFEVEENTVHSIEHSYMGSLSAQAVADLGNLIVSLRAGMYAKHTELDDDRVRIQLGFSQRPGNEYLMRMDYGLSLGALIKYTDDVGLGFQIENQTLLQKTGELRELLLAGTVNVYPRAYLFWTDPIKGLPTLVLFASLRKNDMGSQQKLLDFDTEYELGVLLLFDLF